MRYAQGPVEAERRAPAPLIAEGTAPKAAVVSGSALVVVGGLGALLAGSVGLGAAVWAGVAAAIAGASAIAALGPLRRSRIVGQPSLEVEPEEATPGDPVEATLTITPARAAVLARAEVALVGEEMAALPGETEAEAHREELHADRRTSAPVRLGRGASLVMRERFVVPEGAAPSYAGRLEDVRWEVRATLVTADGDEWRYARRVLVRPRGAAR